MNSPEMPQPAILEGVQEVSSEEWHKFCEDFNALWSRVYRKIGTLEEPAKSLFLNNFLWDSNALYMSVPNKGKYAVYHMCVKGTMNQSIAPYLDFEGENSMAVFFENLEKEVDIALEKQTKTESK